LGDCKIVDADTAGLLESPASTNWAIFFGAHCKHIRTVMPTWAPPWRRSEAAFKKQFVRVWSAHPHVFVMTHIKRYGEQNPLSIWYRN